ncbi:uncharacterized protein LOC128671769 isoform X2 [Plodia interpunctella]|nr:uncharacterized protein LOC128671769 isoform X2 [Plodia interpunctella]
MNMTDSNSSHNTNTDVKPMTIHSDETNLSMDLISFSSNDDNNLGLRKVDSKECIKGNPSKNDNESVKSLSVHSTLNVNAHDYIPNFSVHNIHSDTEINVITNSMDRPEPSTSSPEYKIQPTIQKSHDNAFQSLISYSGFARKTGAVPKKVEKPLNPEPRAILSPEMQRIADYHSKNVRTLIIMRGAPGSGKSYLSRQVIQATVGYSNKIYNSHVFSTDDYFSMRGPYEFNKFRLKDAHAWNQHRSRIAMESGLSPVIIDNTNIEIWEMEPYFRNGVANGYKIEILEPQTTWARKPNQLMKKNIHGVPLSSITRMLDNYNENLTSDYLINYFKLRYPDNMTPPVLRNKPPVISDILNNEQFVPESIQTMGTNKPPLLVKEQENIKTEILNQNHDFLNITTEKVEEVNNFDSKVPGDTTLKNEYTSLGEYCTSTIVKEVFSESTSSIENEQDNKKLVDNSDIQKRLEEYERVDIEWESNPPWDDNIQIKNNSNVRTEPKPPRNFNQTRTSSNEKILNSSNYCANWSDISIFMQPWSDEAQSVEKEPVVSVVMNTTGTSVEIGDTDIYNNQKIFKVLSCNPRDINEHFITPHKEKIPEKRMLDKSTMTNDRLITDITRCKNEEKHFNAFRRMFKTISKSGLRDIFDQCHGDVNWAVEIVLEGISNNQLQFTDDFELSDVEEENPEQCTCLAAYNIVPDAEAKSTSTIRVTDYTNDIPEAITNNVQSNRKSKRVEVPLSEMSVQLKRQIEQNVVISDNHYSQHCLKIRNLRRGEGAPEMEQNIEDTENAVALHSFQSDQDLSSADCSDEESNVSVDEVVVNINVGHEFIKSMDDMFGRRGMTYPENVLPKLSIPMSLINELNALWMESLMHQLDDYDKQSAEMVKQDEEFARQLAAKETEMAEAGKEPEVPDFKEIMDMDFAVALYQKDVDEWRNKVPDNLAAKLTRDKLFNLFPELPQETLSELLVAHDNNFKATVEVLLMSTGKSDLLQEKNGLVKFVMTKERERQEKIVEEEKKALSEVEWPLLPKGENVDMSTVNKYRETAAQHLSRRNQSYNMAQQYIHRGMTSVAVYYSDMAAFHKQMFDQANSRAAATLIQVNAQNSPNNETIDLHYLRVSEALESLDLFLDSHISKLRESQANIRSMGSRQLYLITGRGRHSLGGPRIKPAVRRRLQERGLPCRERNPGLLCARVTADHKLSYQVQI